MILLHFDGEKQREIQTNFQVKKSGSRQIRKKSIWGAQLGEHLPFLPLPCELCSIATDHHAI